MKVKIHMTFWFQIPTNFRKIKFLNILRVIEYSITVSNRTETTLRVNFLSWRKKQLYQLQKTCLGTESVLSARKDVLSLIIKDIG